MLQVLHKSFTRRERKIIAQSGGVKIYVSKKLGEEDKQVLVQSTISSQGTTIVVPSKDVDDETLVHEAVHVLQAADSTRPNDAREMTIMRNATPEHETLNEAMVEAETLSRIDKTSKDPGYYEQLERPREMKDKYHRKLRSNTRAVKSGRHTENVAESFDELEIRNLKLPESK